MHGAAKEQVAEIVQFGSIIGVSILFAKELAIVRSVVSFGSLTVMSALLLHHDHDTVKAIACSG